MGNSHPSGCKTRLEYRPFRDTEAWKQFGARVESGKIMPGTFAQPGLKYQMGIAPPPIDVVTGRSGIRFSEAWSDRVRGSICGIRFHLVGLIQRIANRPAIGGSSDVEQWKQIPGKAESGTHAFL